MRGVPAAHSGENYVRGSTLDLDIRGADELYLRMKEVLLSFTTPHPSPSGQTGFALQGFQALITKEFVSCVGSFVSWHWRYCW